MGAPARPARVSILRRPQHTYNQGDLSATRRCPYPYSLRAITTTDPAILAPNTTNADGTYADVRLPLVWGERCTPARGPIRSTTIRLRRHVTIRDGAYRGGRL